MTPTSIECQSRIQRVIVYARGAVVTRRLELPAELPEGPVEIVAKGITALAEPGSARAMTDGDREVVAVRARYEVPAAPPSPGVLLARARDYHLERQRLRAEMTHLKARRDLLGSLSLDPGMARARLRVDPAARVSDALALSRLVARESETLDARLAAIDEALEQNDRARQAAELAAAQGRSADIEGASRTTLEVIVRLGAGGASAVRSLDVEYVVRAARWFPTYAARFEAAATRVAWTLEAFVAQASGEDWDHVELALSTADLAHDARLPELPSLRLGRAQPPARKGYRPAPQGLDAMFEGYDRFVANLPPAREPPRRLLSSAVGTRTMEPHAHALVQAELAGESLQSLAGAPPTTPTLGMGSDVLWDQDAPDLEEGSAGISVDRHTLPSADPLLPGSYAATVATPPPAVSSASMAMSMAPATRLPGAPLASPGEAFGPQGYVAAERSRSTKAFARAAAPMPVSAMAAGSYKGGGGGAGDALTSWEPAAPADMEPADAWLDFDALFLPDALASKSGRGRLTREDTLADGARTRGAAAAIEQLAVPPNAQDPRESRGHFDHRYDAEGLADVPSNARAHRVSVAMARTSSATRFVTVPREAAEIYREAEIQNPFQAPLLSGPVEVFIDGALLTQSAIGHVDRGGVIRLGLGVEDRLRVARNARVEEASAGLLGGSTAVEHAVTIDLTSSLGRDVEVTVLDRVPVTDDKDVELKTLYVRPAAEAYTQAERGQPIRKGLRWQVPIPAGGKARVELGYKITLSAKSEIVGGNRRE